MFLGSFCAQLFPPYDIARLLPLSSHQPGHQERFLDLNVSLSPAAQFRGASILAFKFPEATAVASLKDLVGHSRLGLNAIETRSDGISSYTTLFYCSHVLPRPPQELEKVIQEEGGYATSQPDWRPV